MYEILNFWHRADNHPFLQYGFLIGLLAEIYSIRMKYFKNQYDHDYNYRNSVQVERTSDKKLFDIYDDVNGVRVKRREKLKNGGIYPREELEFAYKSWLIILIPIAIYTGYLILKIKAWTIFTN